MKIIQKIPNANIRFWGGDLMKNEGGTLVKHYRVGIYGFHQVILI
jgi:lipid-A-disaccharide synthase